MWTMDGQVVIPKGGQKEVLRILHIPHQGVVKTINTAKMRHCWKGIKEDIRRKLQKCDVCA